MNFLLPLAWSLGLLSLPVIAFYLLKTRRRRRPVSTLLFWEQLKPKIENAPLWRKLRRWLSLALQLLILLLIVAALARPAFDWERLEPQRTVFILDPSPSMTALGENGTRWEEALAAAGQAIERLRIEDEMALLLAGEPPRILSGWTSSKRALRQALQAGEQSPDDIDPTSALRLAREMAALRASSRIEMVSDSVWPGRTDEPPGVDLQLVGAADVRNAGFTMFAVRRSAAAPGDWQLEMELVWSGAGTFSGKIEVRQDEVLLDALPVELEPGGSLQKTWRGATESGAAFHAQLIAEHADALPADDTASAVLAPLQPVRVLLVSSRNPFLEAALEAIPLVEWELVDRLPQGEPAGFDLIVVNDAAPPAERPEAALLLIGPTQSGFWGEIQGELKESPITEIDDRLRVARHANLRQVAIDRASDWKPAPGADVLASSLEHPLIFGRWDDAGRWMVLGFPLEESDLLLRTAFPVLLANLVEGLRSREGETRQAARLPGSSESRLKPQVEEERTTAKRTTSLLPFFPGWWIALVLALLFVIGEWALYSRRITE